MSGLAQKSIAELEIDDGEFRVLRQRLVVEKQAIQTELIAVNAELKIRMPQAEYQKALRNRVDLIRQINSKEKEISELNSTRAELETVKQFRKSNAIDVKKLIQLRDDWHSFSMDDKVDPIKRRLAWQFAQQLKEILKPFFASDEPGE